MLATLQLPPCIRAAKPFNNLFYLSATKKEPKPGASHGKPISSPITWTSHKQPWIAQSTTEAEYVALADTTKQGVWLHHLLYTLGRRELYHNTGTPVLEDNKGALDLVDNPAFHSRTKHFYVRLHILRQYRENNEVYPIYCTTGEQLADRMTKALDKILFSRLVDGLRLQQ